MSEIDCNDVLVEIEAYVDGEVEVARFREIETHLGLCPPCLDRADFRQRLKEIVSAKCCDESLPDGLSARIREMLEEEVSGG